MAQRIHDMSDRGSEGLFDAFRMLQIEVLLVPFSQEGFFVFQEIFHHSGQTFLRPPTDHVTRWFQPPVPAGALHKPSTFLQR